MLDDIGYQFVQELMNACPEGAKICASINTQFEEWARPRDTVASGPSGPKGASASKAEAENVNVPIEEVARDSKASLDGLATLRRRGFDLRKHVCSKQDLQDLWAIVGVSEKSGAEEPKVKLTDLAEQAEPREVFLSKFLDSFREPPPGYENKLLHQWDLWPSRRAEDSEVWAKHLAKATIVTMLQTLRNQYPDASYPIACMMNLKKVPRGLQAKEDILERRVVLVPLTNSIKQCGKAPHPGEEPRSAFQVKFIEGLPDHPAWEFFLMKPKFQGEVQGNDEEAQKGTTKDGGAQKAETKAGETKAQEKKQTSTKDGGAQEAGTKAGETKAQENKRASKKDEEAQEAEQKKHAEFDALFWRVLLTDQDYVGEQ